MRSTVASGSANAFSLVIFIQLKVYHKKKKGAAAAAPFVEPNCDP